MNANDKAGQDFYATFEDQNSNQSFEEREQKVRSQFWVKLTRFAGRVPFVDDAVAVYYCAMDTNTPVRVRGTLLAALAYFIMPADMIPDILVGVGLTDDAAILAAVMGLLTTHIKPHHRAAAAKALGKDLPPADSNDQPI
jgi:uncharacterized membrane protein YkvA (DUF1232 family)